MANSTQHTLFIEQSLIMLLQSSNLEMKQLAANYAYHFNEEEILSTNCVDEILALLRKDSEIDYYADMFFPSKSL